jgi:site-specific recombinase XerD
LSFAAAGAFCSEISTLDFQDVSLTLASMKYVRVGRSAADERELLLGGDGLRAVNDYIGLRQDMSWVKDSALFVSHNFPFRRLSPAVISGQIGFAINETGLKGMAISPGALHRSAPGDALKAGFGGRVAAALGGYKSPPFARPVAASASEMSDLIERHHPMSRLDL